MKKQLLFIISEDRRNLESLRSITSANYFEPKCFHSAEEFLQYVTPRQAGCVVVDSHDAVVNVGAFVASLRETAAQLRSIVIAAEENDTDWLRLGAFAVLRRPCSAESLFEAIDRAWRVEA
jgi:FixJ family two-component response regulator